MKRGYDLPSHARVEGSVPIVSSSGISAYHAVSQVEGPGVVTGRYGTIGQVFYVNRDFWPLNTTLYVQDFKGYPPRFVFHVLERINFHKYVDKAAVPGINRNHLHEEQVVLPPLALTTAFADMVAPIWARHTKNVQESRTLANLRETLLPKLLSGEISVADLESKVAAAV